MLPGYFLKRVPENISSYLENSTVRVQKHPTEDLYIYNYTEKCQYEKIWDDVTLQCRGLIADGSGKIVARPFPKFFNLAEHDILPMGNFKAYEKYDGSLGILYWINDEPFIATRGSFQSEQAVVASVMIKEHDVSRLNREYTYLFEIIYPTNRIVVDYGNMRDLVLLGAIETESGKFIDPEKLSWDGEKAVEVKVEKLADFKELESKNKEGFVVRYKNGVMAKFKFDEYVRLHRLLTGITSRKIWELMKEGDNLETLYTNVPDEFYNWLKEETLKIDFQFRALETTSRQVYEMLAHIDDRAKFAGCAKLYWNPALIFALRDGKDIKPMIWKIIKPKASYPFKTEI